jgi:radical SAM superfamily enzyme YgiQ (UPF0313 family)
MKVWLINPPTRTARRMGINGVVDTLFYNSPPLGLASLAAVLEQEGHGVVITDAPALGMVLSDLETLARQVAPDVVGLTATTSYFRSATDSAARLRQLLPRALLCLGGPHLTGRPEALLGQPSFDLGVVGEGELTLRDVVRAVEAGRPWADLPGVVSVQDGALHRGPPRPVIEDLDTLPLPARHLLPLHAYRPMPNDQRALPKASMIASRGCPFACIFCEKVVFGQHYRAVSPGRLVQEMHHLTDRWGARDIAIVDSTFTPDRPRTLAVLEAMERRPPQVSWTASCRANLLDRGILERMRALGCWRIRIAIESGNDAILKTIRKGITKEEYAHTVSLAASLGFSVKGFFMVGHIGETAATLQESIEFACSLELDDVTVQINTPLPGAAQYAMCREHGTLDDTDPASLNFFEPVFVPHGLTREQLLAAQRQFYRSFYLRPRQVRRFIRDMSRPSDLTRYLRAIPVALDVMAANRLRTRRPSGGKSAPPPGA